MNQSNNVYKIGITGAKVQNVGLRKNLHEILNEGGIGGVAVNNPDDSSVDAYISGDPKTRTQAYTKLRDYIKKKTGHNIKIQETLSNQKLHDVRLNKRDLNDTANTQYLMYMMRNDDINRTGIRGLGLKKSEDDLIPRFRLKKTKSGEYTGRLPQRGVDKIYGRSAHYEKFQKQNLRSSQEDAIGRMHPSDRVTMKATLRRRDVGLAYQ